MLKVRKLSKEKRMAKRIKEMLNKRGFIVTIQVSKNTNSVYLKIDNGACGKIRISDHKNNLTNCKFNMIKNYNGKRSEYSNRVFKKYYNYNGIGRLIADIEIERADSIAKYGYYKYRTIRDKENNYTQNLNNERKVA